MSDQLILSLVIIGGAIGLALVGIAIWMMRSETPAEQRPASEMNASPTEPPAETPAAPPEEPAARPEPAVSEPVTVPEPVAAPSAVETDSTAAAAPPPASEPPAVDEEIMRVWRLAQGDLAVEVNGQVFHSRQELVDAGLEASVASAARDLGRLLSSPVSAAPPKPPNVPPRPVTKVSLEEAAKMEIKRPSMDITKQFRYLREQQKQPEIHIKTVAEEIDEVLQEMILGTALVGRELKVSDSAHGVSFSVDGQIYDSVDSIPDGDARNAIRSAIQKWDQK